MMRTPVLAISLLFALPALGAELDGGDPIAATLDADTAPIVRVTLYPDRALVTRSATVRLGKGRQVVRFEGLPIALERETIRVRVQGAGELLAVHADTTWAEEERSELVAEIVPAIEKGLLELQGRAARVARSEAGLHHLARLAAAVAALVHEEMGRPSPDLSRLGSALDGLRSELPGLLDGRRDSVLTAEALQREVSSLRARLDQVGYPDYGAATRGIVRLESETGGDVTIELSYGMLDASWSPSYQLRIKGDTVELVVQAAVRQRTGEPWNDVQFGISTSSPKGLIPAPRVPRSVVTAYEREDRSRRVGSSYEEREELDGDGWSAPAKTGKLRVRTRGTGFHVDASERATILADGRVYRVVLLRGTADAERDLYVAPERGRRVLRRVQTVNASGIALLSGPADVFSETGFIGTTRLPATAAGAPLAFALGAQEGLSVEHELDQARLRQVETGIRKKIHYDIEIEAKNTGTETKTFLVEERIPVSRLKELKVQLRKETSEGYELDEKQGFVRWTVELAPDAKKKLRLYYVLDMPKDFFWQGM
jgi:uncharacterized protein (TIGR02231 family)